MLFRIKEKLENALITEFLLENFLHIGINQQLRRGELCSPAGYVEIPAPRVGQGLCSCRHPNIGSRNGQKTNVSTGHAVPYMDWKL